MLCAVWSEVKKQQEQVKAKNIHALAEFKELVREYPMLEKLLENQVHGMIEGALNYKHDYHIR